MGYSTKYELTVRGADFEEVTTELEDIAGFDPLAERTKWYEHVDDMVKLCRRFPDAVFMLEGAGEESGDIWRAYFKHGEKPVRQEPELVFPDPPSWSGGLV